MQEVYLYYLIFAMFVMQLAFFVIKTVIDHRSRNTTLDYVDMLLKQAQEKLIGDVKKWFQTEPARAARSAKAGIASSNQQFLPKANSFIENLALNVATDLLKENPELSSKLMKYLGFDLGALE